jgi:hypothetical protein
MTNPYSPGSRAWKAWEVWAEARRRGYKVGDDGPEIGERPRCKPEHHLSPDEREQRDRVKTKYVPKAQRGPWKVYRDPQSRAKRYGKAHQLMG